MNFIVTVTTANNRICFVAIKTTASQIFDNVYDAFGVCAVSIKQWRKHASH